MRLFGEPGSVDIFAATTEEGRKSYTAVSHGDRPVVAAGTVLCQKTSGTPPGMVNQVIADLHRSSKGAKA